MARNVHRIRGFQRFDDQLADRGVGAEQRIALELLGLREYVIAVARPLDLARYDSCLAQPAVAAGAAVVDRQPGSERCIPYGIGAVDEDIVAARMHDDMGRHHS